MEYYFFPSKESSQDHYEYTQKIKPPVILNIFYF